MWLCSSFLTPGTLEPSLRQSNQKLVFEMLSERLLSEDDDDKLALEPMHDTLDDMKDLPKCYRGSNDHLLSIGFVELADYIHYPHQISIVINQLARRGIFYLAAAVSDFYAQPNNVSTNKINSAGQLKLTLQLTKVSSSIG